jgi:hypothetical protein
MLLGFKRQFVPYIREGSKRHTIRDRRSRRPKAGEICHNYCGLRQKGAELLGRWPCVKVQEIRVALRYSHPSPLVVEIDGVQLSPDEVEALFFADGFRSRSGHSFPATSEAAAFWKGKLAKADFVGDLIHWDFANPVEQFAGKGRAGS